MELRDHRSTSLLFLSARHGGHRHWIGVERLGGLRPLWV
ncbi:hypothetical protein SZ55_5298 [Pseudomonas sp. FeS53a]|nr:hypothetical protein SZ55_5298 [Pseudomonas sp. FeS53a]